jgi:hypothetical protein
MRSSGLWSRGASEAGEYPVDAVIGLFGRTDPLGCGTDPEMV